MTCVKRVLFVVVLLTLIAFLILGAHTGSRRLTLISSREAEALVQGLSLLTDDPDDMDFGTLTIEGVKAPFDFDADCYFLPQSMKPSGLDGLIAWSDRTKSVYLVADDFDKSQSIADGQKLALLIVGRNGYFSCDLILTGLPLLTLDSDDAANQLYGDAKARGAILRVYDPEGSPDGGYSVFSSGVRYQRRGGSTLAYDKPQYKLSFLTNGGKSRSASVLGLQSSPAILMSAQEYEGSRFRDALCKTLWNELCALSPARSDYYTPNSRFAEMLMNGSYLGLYSFFEKSPLAVNSFDKSDVLAKVRWVSMSDRAAYSLQSGEGALYENLYFPLISGDASQLPRIKSFVAAAEEDRFLSINSGLIFHETNAFDYALFVNAVSGVDNVHGNYYLVGAASRVPSPLARIPWDLDRTFGKPFGEEVQFDPDLVAATILPSEIKTLVSDHAAWMRLSARWQELRQSVFASEHIEACMTDYARLLQNSGAYTREAVRWQNGPDPLLYQTMIAYSNEHLAFLDDVFSDADPARFLALGYTS